MRRWRKDTIFRVYLTVFAVAFILSGVAALAGQRRFYVHRLDSMDSRVQDLASRLESLQTTVDTLPDTSAQESSDSSSPARPAADPWWVEGHGFNGRYAYLDIEFPDGYRARYYFRPYPSRGELVNLHRRIAHDSVKHSFPFDEDES